jgi:hypothetical protein
MLDLPCGMPPMAALLRRIPQGKDAGFWINQKRIPFQSSIPACHASCSVATAAAKGTLQIQWFPVYMSQGTSGQEATSIQYHVLSNQKYGVF